MDDMFKPPSRHIIELILNNIDRHWLNVTIIVSAEITWCNHVVLYICFMM